MSTRSRISTPKFTNQEHELHIYANPLATPRSPLISPASSKWMIVRKNLHKIRSWGGSSSTNVNDKCRVIQMRRELRRMREQIRDVEHRSDFVPVRCFRIPTDEKNSRRYKVSHVSPTSVLYHPSFDEEPIVLQSLFFYFSRECHVPYQSIFRPLLTNICSALDRDRERLERTTALRRFALIIAIIVFAVLGLMFITLIVGVLKTRSNFHKLYDNDIHGGLEWEPTVDSF